MECDRDLLQTKKLRRTFIPDLTDLLFSETILFR